MPDMQTEAGAPLISSPSTEQPSPGRPPRRPRLFVVLVVAALVVYAADQLAKAWALAHLDPDRPQDVIGSLVRFDLTLIAAAVVVVIVVTSRRLGSRGWAWALGLLLGGSVGNPTDRMVRAPGPGRGHVQDFIELPPWPIFNIADSAIVTAAVLIGMLAVRGISIDGTR